MVSQCVCITEREREGEIYEIKWPSLRDKMSNSEALSPICVINACRQPFGCLLADVEELFTFQRLCLWHFCFIWQLKIVSSDRKGGRRKGEETLCDKGWEQYFEALIFYVVSSVMLFHCMLGGYLT